MAFKPLAGVRVVDLTSSLAGPTCTEILGGLGAEVVKVEHPARGDEARAWGPSFYDGGSVMFFAANRSKRSLALDFKDPEGMSALLRLIDSRGCLRAVDASRRCRPARPWERRPAGAKRAARVLLDPCVRAPRAARLRGWLRPVDAGVRGPDQHHGRAGPARCPGRHVAHRHRHRRLGRARHRGCSARAERRLAGVARSTCRCSTPPCRSSATSSLRRSGPVRRRAVTEQPFR